MYLVFTHCIMHYFWYLHTTSKQQSQKEDRFLCNVQRRSGCPAFRDVFTRCLTASCTIFGMCMQHPNNNHKKGTDFLNNVQVDHVQMFLHSFFTRCLIVSFAIFCMCMLENSQEAIIITEQIFWTTCMLHTLKIYIFLKCWLIASCTIFGKCMQHPRNNN